MAGLSIAALEGSNSTQITCSTWIRFPGSPVNSGFFNGIFRFGRSATDEFSNNHLTFIRESGGNRVTFSLVSSAVDNNGDYGRVDGTAQTTVAYDAWHHVLFSCELANPSLRVPQGTGTQAWQPSGDLVEWPGWPNTTIWVQESTPTSSTPETDPDHDPPRWDGVMFVTSGALSGSNVPLGLYYVYTPSSVTLNNFGDLLTGKTINCMIDGQSVWFQNTPPRAARNQFEGTPVCGTWPGSDPNGRDPVPALPMMTNGYEFGIPTRGDFLDAFTTQYDKTEYQDFYFWSGLFVDPTDAPTFARFVNIAGNVGRPQNPSIPIAAYGTPTVHYRGKASDNTFYENRGSGGTAAKTGVITDFTPTASYGG